MKNLYLLIKFVSLIKCYQTPPDFGLPKTNMALLQYQLQNWVCPFDSETKLPYAK